MPFFKTQRFLLFVLASFTLVSASCDRRLSATPSSASIVGGQIPDSSSPATKSTVALVKKDLGNSGYSSFCSGILIAPRLVLTAAHCVESNKSNLSVLFAAADTDPSAKVVEIEKTLTFDKDGSRFFPNFDIAWVRLKADAPAPWQPVELLRSSAALAELEGQKDQILLAGFGRRASVCSNSDCMGRLYEVWTSLEHFFNEAHFVNLLVIGPNPGHGTCNGDSGGPAFVKRGDRWYLAGILNGKSPLLNSPNLWQKGVCESGEAIYNFAGAYIDWIEETSGITLTFDDAKNPSQVTPLVLAKLSSLGASPSLETLLTFNNYRENLWASVDTLMANFKDPINRYGETVEALVTQPELAADTMRRWTEFRHHGISFDFVISSQKSNQLVDVTAVGELAGIKTLVLDSNKIVDTAPLGKLTQLEELGLKNNYDYSKKRKVAWNFAFMANLTQLKRLDLSSNSGNIQLEDIPWDRFAALEKLELSDNGRGLDLYAVPWAKLKNLKTLTIRNSVLKNIDALKDARSLETLDLSRNSIESIDSLAGLSNLSYLDLSMNRIRTFASLANLKQLKNLKALSNLQDKDDEVCPEGAACVFSPASFSDFESYCRFAFTLSTDDLTHWSGGATVMRLIQIAGTDPLRLDGCKDAQLKLSRMTEIDLSGSPSTPVLEDLSPLAPLTQLTKLNLANNQLRDIKSLAGMVHLESLNLSQNYIDDLGPLAGMTSLKMLDVDGNFVISLMPLSSIYGLTVFARSNPIAIIACPITFGTCVFDDRLSF